MNIQDATRKALEIDGFIHRKNGVARTAIKPTNSLDCCKAHRRGEVHPGWRPKADDLLADDWVVYTRRDGVGGLVGFELEEDKDAASTPAPIEGAIQATFDPRTLEEFRDILHAAKHLCALLEKHMPVIVIDPKEKGTEET